MLVTILENQPRLSIIMFILNQLLVCHDCQDKLAKCYVYLER